MALTIVLTVDVVYPISKSVCESACVRVSHSLSRTVDSLCDICFPKDYRAAKIDGWLFVHFSLFLAKAQGWSRGRVTVTVAPKTDGLAR